MHLLKLFSVSVCPDKPGLPVGPVRIDEVDGLSVTMSWEPPEKDGGANVSGYVVEQREAHIPGWSTVSESVTRPCFKFTRLTEGTEYVFRVAAMNRFGFGGFLQSEVVECKSAKSKFFPYFSLLISFQPSANLLYLSSHFPRHLSSSLLSSSFL